MGTRGAIVLVADGQEKVLYNHFDSYPEGLGEDVLLWLREVGDIEEDVRRQVIALQKVPYNRKPTAEDIERLAEFHDPNVSTGADWYSLLRRTQGDLSAVLRAGLYEDAAEFPLDSLFCEWAYVVDFDERRFEVYEGFRKTPTTEGRWAGKPGADSVSGTTYYPVQRIASWSFDRLPLPLGQWWTVPEFVVGESG